MPLERTRPFFTTNSKLKDIPREWIVEIEPKIARGGILKECWIWTGGLDHKGHPCLWFMDADTKKNKCVRLARMVAKMFWPGLEQWNDVLHGCGNKTCLNPAHFRISKAHWTQEDRSPSQELEGETGTPIPGVHVRQKTEGN